MTAAITWGGHTVLRTPEMLVPLAILALGCESRAPEGAATTRDSAGIRIVESVTPRWRDGEGWEVRPDEALDLTRTGSGPEHEFQSVRDLRVLPDGRIVVVDEGVDEVRLYGPDGSFLRSIGREGEGPGEFRRPISAEPFRGDSLAIWDFWQRRLTVVDSDLTLGRVATLPDPALRSQRIHWLGDSTFVGTLYTLEGAADPGYYRIPVQVARLSFDTAARDTVATLAGFEGFLFERGDAAPPFARQSHVAAGGGRIVAGSADRMEFLVFTAEGRLERIVRVPGYDLEITAADLEVELEPWTSPDAPPELRTLAREMPVPETRPAYSKLILDAEGFLWARAYQLRGRYGEGTRWEVFDPDGRWLGTVETPARFTVLSIGARRIAGVYRDSLDVQHPRILGLRR